ncbi:MAG: RNA 2'-phosphotransferase [Collinsella sp.]
MTDARHVRASKMLACALRHKPGEFGIELDAHGWAQVGPLVRGMKGKVEFSRDILEHIVATDPKGRYEFDARRTRVRARQGHSVPVDVELERREPPAVLYHGTAMKYLDKISAGRASGRMRRLYVHPSPDRQTALWRLARGTARPVVLKVDAAAMAAEGGREFYLSRNGVWLAGPVEPRFLEVATWAEGDRLGDDLRYGRPAWIRRPIAAQAIGKRARRRPFLIVAGDFGYPWDFSEDEGAEIAWLESRHA